MLSAFSSHHAWLSLMSSGLRLDGNEAGFFRRIVDFQDYQMMSPSTVFQEDFCSKPSATCEKLYEKKAARDHIFQETSDCGIHAHFSLLNSTDDRKIQNETQLTKFCKVDAKIGLRFLKID